MEQVIPVFFDDNQAKQLAEFIKHYEVINTLLTKGAFTIKNGSCIINYDANGSITSLEIKTIHRP